jgi:chromosome segregation ATPase
VADELTGGLEPQTEQDASEEQTFDAAYVKKLRDEAAGWRTKYRGAETVVKELTPIAEQYQQQQEAAKTEAERMAEQLAGLQAKLAETERQATESARRAAVIALASKAGVNSDVVELLDLSKIDLEDEEAALTTLGKFKVPNSVGQSASNPGSKTPDNDPETWFKNRTSGPNIFGG